MSRVLGTAFGVATLGTLAWLSRRLRPAPPGGTALWSVWDTVPAWLLAGVPGYACWSSGGLETQMFAFLVTLGAAWHLDEILSDRAPRPRTALAFGIAALTRPEGILFFAVSALHRELMRLGQRRERPWAADLRWLGAFTLLVVPHFVWRRWYYGWWLPNTFYIKSSGVGGTWRQGGYYLWSVVEQFHIWVVPLLCAAGLAAQPTRSMRVLVGYAALTTGVFAVYVASIGGDFMGLFRFVMPVIPLVVLLAASSLAAALSPLARRAPSAVAAVVVAMVGLHAWHAAVIDRRALVIGSDRGIDTPGYLRWYTADRAAVGKWFGRYARPDDYAAVGGAGAQVYFSGIRSLDCFGLSDEHIAHTVPARSSRPGHQKYAPDAYILAKRPTIITSYNYQFVFAPYVGPDAELWMQRGYHYVTVSLSGAHTPMYAFLLRNDRSFGPLPALTEDQ